jgi:hypothetical protein
MFLTMSLASDAGDHFRTEPDAMLAGALIWASICEILILDFLLVFSCRGIGERQPIVPSQHIFLSIIDSRGGWQPTPLDAAGALIFATEKLASQNSVAISGFS